MFHLQPCPALPRSLPVGVGVGDAWLQEMSWSMLPPGGGADGATA